MDNSLVIVAVGEHQPSLVKSFFKAIGDLDGRVIDSHMNLLGGHITLSCMVSGSWDSIAKIENLLLKLQDQLALVITARRTLPAHGEQRYMPYIIDAVSLYRVSVVADVVRFISDSKIRIQEFHSHTYRAYDSGSEMLALHMTLHVPDNMSISGLRNDFMDFCDNLNIDATIEPIK